MVTMAISRPWPPMRARRGRVRMGSLGSRGFWFSTVSYTHLYVYKRQAYYDEPAGALGMPEFTVSLYPASGGQQRIVEILSLIHI